MLSNSEVAVFCEQSGMILESGLSMLEGISIMEEDVELHNTEYKKMYEDMRMCLEETGIFHEALTKTGLFPSYVIQMTKIGEETGNLDVVMKGLAAYYEREENTMQDIKNAISYPLMILCMLLAIMLVMVVKVVPLCNAIEKADDTLALFSLFTIDFVEKTFPVSLRNATLPFVVFKSHHTPTANTQRSTVGIIQYCFKASPAFKRTAPGPVICVPSCSYT